MIKGSGSDTVFYWIRIRVTQKDRIRIRNTARGSKLDMQPLILVR